MTRWFGLANVRKYIRQDALKFTKVLRWPCLEQACQKGHHAPETSRVNLFARATKLAIPAFCRDGDEIKWHTGFRFYRSQNALDTGATRDEDTANTGHCRVTPAGFQPDENGGVAHRIGGERDSGQCLPIGARFRCCCRRDIRQVTRDVDALEQDEGAGRMRSHRLERWVVCPTYSNSGASFASTSSMIAEGTPSKRRPWRAPRSSARG